MSGSCSRASGSHGRRQHSHADSLVAKRSNKGRISKAEKKERGAEGRAGVEGGAGGERESGHRNGVLLQSAATGMMSDESSLLQVCSILNCKDGKSELTCRAAMAAVACRKLCTRHR